MTAVRGHTWGGVAARTIGLGLALVVGSAGCGGCGGGTSDGYDSSLQYPLRTDALVVRVPPATPPGPAAPGKLDDAIAHLGEFGGKVIDPAKLSDAQKIDLRKSLDEMFGTPAEPKIAVAGVTLSSPGELAKGSQLYRRNCAHCHGLTGDGRGPTGPWLYPYPRDFRQGVFKLAVSGKPRSDALKRLMRAGMPGTSMPAFESLTDAEMDALLAYLTHLSLRGESEYRAMIAVLDDAEGDAAGDVKAEATSAATRAAQQWQAAASASEPPVPGGLPAEPKTGEPAFQESARRGQKLFMESAGCASCHADYGRADQYRYDVWGAVVRATDLTRPDYRWGREPSDLARHVKYGIFASGMPANPSLSDDQVRDLVAFVQALPYPPRLPTDVRAKVYPPGGPQR